MFDTLVSAILSLWNPQPYKSPVQEIVQLVDQKFSEVEVRLDRIEEKLDRSLSD